jgi:hypothetical protein
VKKFARILGCSVVSLVVAFAVQGPADAEQEWPEVRLADGQFQPSELTVPADAPFAIRVTNASDAAIEFESVELHRERVVQPGETIVVRFAGISAGSYNFFDDFHTSVPPGAIVAK